MTGSGFRVQGSGEELRFGDVPDGWREPRRWAEHLRHLAEACRALHPGRAAELERWAEAVEETGSGSRVPGSGEDGS